MSKFKIEVADFGKNNSETHSFTSAKERERFVQDETIGEKKEVYMFLFKKYIYDNDLKNEDIYIFKNYSCIAKICDERWTNCFLAKFDSYKSAYLVASALRGEIIGYTPPEQKAEDLINFFKSNIKS